METDSTPDAQQTREREKLTSTQCMKNPGHRNFTRLENLQIDHLPEAFRKEPWVKWIYLKGMTTVKLTRKATSKRRPPPFDFRGKAGETRVIGSGTVFVGNMGNKQKCPFENCKEKTGSHDVSGLFTVYTAAHVIFDDFEAENTEIEFFFNNESKRDVVVARGVHVKRADFDSRLSIVMSVTHDLTLYQKLEEGKWHLKQIMEKSLRDCLPEEKLVMVISHPHGQSKHVSFGKLRRSREFGDVKTMADGTKLIGCFLTYDAPTCPGSGGGTVLVLGGKNWSIAFAPHCAVTHDLNESGLGWIIKQ